jgi:hypothetical protein
MTGVAFALWVMAAPVGLVVLLRAHQAFHAVRDHLDGWLMARRDRSSRDRVREEIRERLEQEQTAVVDLGAWRRNHVQAAPMPAPTDPSLNKTAPAPLSRPGA